ncbi:MAG: hypothetical protein K2X99_12415, partial [Gemmatimonadaceae bacterium]|nr:hypothetical protein [Gemmatimonadaceae bacterium]
MIRTPSFRVRAWLAAACATTLPLAAQGSMGVPLSADALRTRLFAYAADSMMGREAGSPYNIKATQYIADELKKFSGLKPGGPSGSWFQDVPLVKATFDKSSGISVGGRALKPYDEFLPRLIPEGAPRSVDGVRVIYGGTWGDSASLIPAAAGAGKAILLSVDPKGAAPTRIGVLSRYGSAAAVVLINRDYIGAAEVAAYTAAPVVLKSSEARPLVPMYTHVTHAVAELMLGAPLSGAKPGTEGATLQGAVRFTDAPQPARNVIAILPGSDPKLSATYLAVGAHNDHVGYQVGGSVDHDSARVAYTVVRNRQNANKGVLTREMFNVTVNMDSLRKAVPVARRDSIFNGAD